MAEYHERAGHIGGTSCAKKYGVDYMRELGRRGGKSTAAQYDMAYIGRIGGRRKKRKEQPAEETKET